MAHQILHGHFSAFYWGQDYGGGEPYITALFLGIFGQRGLTLEFTPILLSGMAAVLTWRIALRVRINRFLAMLAGALVWVAPNVNAWTSALELGFRWLTMCCGLGIVLVSLRILDGQRGFREFLLLASIIRPGSG
jgi:hypothetical protein